MHRLAIALTTLLLAASCGGDDDESDSGGGLALVEDAFVVDLDPVGGSRVSGTADFRAVEGETQVTFNLVGAAGTAVQATLPVHLHFGNCADPQQGVAYQLVPVGEGGSRTTLDLTLDELQTDEFAITVHAAGPAGEHVACGDLSDARAGTG
jgi:hypothetical protein